MLLNDVPLFFLALLLGVKHAYDADHLIAVSTYLPKSKSLGETLKMSISWAIGHMTTAAIITLIIFNYRDIFLQRILGYFETIVGFMLITLGIISILHAKGYTIFHEHEHDHDPEGHHHPHVHVEGEIHTHYHHHMFGIGIIHGLASNDELIVLFTASLGVSTLTQLMAYIALYTFGVVVGMISFGIAITYPLLKARKEALTMKFMLAIGFLSVIYGLFIIKEGLSL